MNKKEQAFTQALLNKISKEPNIAFYSNNIFDSELLGWDDIERLLNDPYRTTIEQIELIDKSNKKIDIPTFTSAWCPASRVSTKFVFDKINANHSLVILGASKITQDINSLCLSIESTIPNTSVDVHVYCGLKKSKSFRAHYDNADNIILHQSGKCHWKLYKQHAQDCDFQPNVNGKKLDVEFECDIGPGDFIYVPKHQYHECFPLSKRVSLSFPIINSNQKLDRNWYSINNK